MEERLKNLKQLNRMLKGEGKGISLMVSYSRLSFSTALLSHLHPRLTLCAASLKEIQKICVPPKDSQKDLKDFLSLVDIVADEEAIPNLVKVYSPLHAKEKRKREKKKGEGEENKGL